MTLDALQIAVAVLASVVSSAAFVITYLRIKRERAEEMRRTQAEEIARQLKEQQRNERQSRQHAHA
jgi:hypothetical protein